MARRTDWGSWLSLSFIALVCVLVASPALPLPQVSAASMAKEKGKEKDKARPKDKDNESDEEKEAELAAPAPAARAGRTERGAAQRPSEPKPAVEPSPKSGYKLNAPSRSITLDKALNEISGLSIAKGGESLWAVHDERGTLFRISVLDGSIQKEIDLGKRADFEAVEEVGDRVYVARSDGVMLVVDPEGKAEIEKLVFTKDIGLACDLEGIAYETKHHRMLLACKNEGWRTSRKDGKAYEIYALDLESKKVDEEPVFVVRAKDLDELGVKGKAFAASALAVHPKTGEIYILSARGGMLVVLSPDGKVERAEKLDSSVHLQPEGIAFAEDGTMYVSDEAHGYEPKLHIIKE